MIRASCKASTGVGHRNIGAYEGMTGAHVSATTQRPSCVLLPVRGSIALMLIALLWPVGARSQYIPCDRDAHASAVADALGRIERSVDPCGESAQVVDVLTKFAHCSTTAYRICTSLTIDRNLFDRPSEPPGEASPRTITWNPELRTELELGCDGDPRRPVLRDPTASLLHEIVHAVQDCAGLNPGEHEMEAVRIENIYRRAAGLCQRSGYGDAVLPARMARVCSATSCPCSAPPEAPGNHVVHRPEIPSRGQPADGSQSSATAPLEDSTSRASHE